MKKLTEYGFEGRGRRQMYAWDEWFDGSIWRAERGIDFQCEPESFRVQACTEAKQRGIKVQTSVEGDAVIFQALIEDSAARTVAD